MSLLPSDTIGTSSFIVSQELKPANVGINSTAGEGEGGRGSIMLTVGSWALGGRWIEKAKEVTVMGQGRLTKYPISDRL